MYMYIVALRPGDLNIHVHVPVHVFISTSLPHFTIATRYDHMTPSWSLCYKCMCYIVTCTCIYMYMYMYVVYIFMNMLNIQGESQGTSPL